MDPITHLFLGGALAVAMAPAKHRRAALLAGAVLNTLPDLDVLPLALVDDPVAVMTWHRSMTHSLLVLPLVALALWFPLRDRLALFRDAPARGFWLILACLLAHPLIDAFTVYGTQLWWPLATAPTMWSSLFIIDPAFTLPLVVGCVLAFALRDAERARRAATVGASLAALYVGWSLLAKWQVDRAAEERLTVFGLQHAPRFSTPMPFNTLLWRVVVMLPDGSMEAQRSLVAEDGPMVFMNNRTDPETLAAEAAVAGYPAVRRLRWFNHGFMRAERRDGHLVLSDLRMGAYPDYSFRFEVARQTPAGWRPQAVRQLPWPWDARRRLPQMWHRIWNGPYENP